MAAATLPAVVEDIDLPAAPPARPRVLLVGTVLATAASLMAVGGVLAVYLRERSLVISETGRWFPEDVEIPLMPGTMGLATMLMSAVFVQWAVHAIGNDDRRHTWMALGLVLVFGAAQMNEMAYYTTQMGLAVSTFQGALVYALMGMHLAMVGVGMLFVALMAFRSLGGRYSAKDKEGIVAAAIFWHATVGVYALIWYSVFVTK